ncbi:hypothetical protein BS47DRAFT_533341 [Hydnum rufescens UP504]|uniref:Uncharacterized protein n=1 Tax=Hydnum rufescens UP504 TaxID=1448309 RepID=A0A9P6B4I4_9AGAM|nr:hypothetical protein BS47DRAFT_533341 [Hydnum rufescens UP504]
MSHPPSITKCACGFQPWPIVPVDPPCHSALIPYGSPFLLSFTISCANPTLCVLGVTLLLSQSPIPFLRFALCAIYFPDIRPSVILSSAPFRSFR